MFEAPYYAYLLTQCAKLGLAPSHLPKANYALDHGELGLGSKYSTQTRFAQERFLPTELVSFGADEGHNAAAMTAFAAEQSFPFIVKPDIGAVGKGIMKIESGDDVAPVAAAFRGDYLLQAFTPHPCEYGLFFVRRLDTNRITGINQKHFPTVLGNGRDTIQALARAHYRYTDHWRIFLRYLNIERVPADGEEVRLSFIGSHTMGCMFTDDTPRASDAMARTLYEICDSQPGFNFGRLDVKAESEEAFLDGEFVVVEVNGIASLPTHMFDPANSLRRAYQIFFAHGSDLVHVANEHRAREMPIDSIADIWRRAKQNYEDLEEMHRLAQTV